MRFTVYFILAFILFTAFAGCKTRPADTSRTSSSDSSVSKPAAELTGTYWKLTELNGEKIAVDTQYTHEPYLVLQVSDSTIKGNGGCNGFGGKFEWKAPNRVKFSEIISTMMACDKTPTENQYFKMLEAVDNYYVVADTLILNKAKMAPLSRFQAVLTK